MGFHYLCLLILFTEAVSGYTVNDCPLNLVRDSNLHVHGSSCYTLVTHVREFPAAEAECRSRGGHLVVIRNAETQQFLLNTFGHAAHLTSGAVWIGMTDAEREGVHHWLDGSPITYTHWAPGEPSGAEYDCAVMDFSRQGVWVDNMCQDSTFTNHRHPFVCENVIMANATASANTTSLMGLQHPINDCPSSLPAGSHLYVHGSNCFDFVTGHSLEFNAAELECELRNGRLVTIHNAETQQFIYRTFTQDLGYHGVVWIGLSDQQTEGQHLWVDGSSVTYTHWAAGEPAGATADCAVMKLSENGLWYDYRCADHNGFFTTESGHHYFVCQYPLSGAQVSVQPSTTVTPYTVANCPHGTPQNGHLHVYGSSCYDFVSAHPKEFSNAERECSLAHGHLVTIRDAGTQSFIYQTFLHDFPRFRDVVWIGLTDRQYEGVHVWTDGSPVTYTNWSPGEPTGSDTDCAIMNIGEGGVWYDYSCTDTFPIFGSDAEHYFVCEYPIVQTTTSTTSTTSRSTTTTVTTVTTKSTTPTPAAVLPACYQCGDLDHQVPCTQAELNASQPEPCPSSSGQQRFCMIDIYKESQETPVKYYKRCVDETSCNMEFYMQYERSDFCLHLDEELPDILACHICCVGDHCNQGTRPSLDSLYKPLNSTAAAATTITIRP